MENTRRVAITGMGLISPLGNTPAALWNALCEGQSGVRPLRSIPENDLPSPFAAEAIEFSGAIGDFGELEKTVQRNIRKNLKVMCREIAMGVAAAQRAFSDASLNAGLIDPERTGVVYGCDHIQTIPEEFSEGVASCRSEEDHFAFDRWADDGLTKIGPLWLLKYLPNMPASHIAIYNNLRGPNNSITLREASSNLSVGEALATIQRGWADVMIAGATGTRVHPIRSIHVSMQEEIAQGNESPQELCRPFDRGRTGMVLGEGAGAIVMEEWEHAKARGAKILGEVAGSGSSAAISKDFTANLDIAIRNVMTQSLRHGSMKPNELGHIHAHGLATRNSDRQEAKAICDVFGDHPIPVTAAKSYLGNLGAAGGMVELIASILALQHGRLFPILNFTTPDPECPIQAAVGNDVGSGDSFLNVNASPQGQASAVLIKRAA